MTLSLPASPSLSHLKKQAKALLAHFRLNDGDKYQQAFKTIQQYHPKPELFLGLRDAQLVIARQYACTDWTELTQAVEVAVITSKTLGEQADIFIELACVQYNGGGDNAVNYQRARQLLKWNPKIASHNFYVAIVANNVGVVKEFLTKDMLWASRKGGPLKWFPIHYLTYSRIDEPSGQAHALEILELLLTSGADVNSSRLLNDIYRFTALTGVMGEGERGSRHQPPHQYSKEMAVLLLEAGANPNDSQGLYDTMFEQNSMEWLTLLIDFGLDTSHKVNWSDSADAQSCFDFLLSSAVRGGIMDRVIFLLGQGADSNAVNVYNQRSAYANAVIVGRNDIADYLVEHGATTEVLSRDDQFKSVIAAGDDDGIEKIIEQDPVLMESTDFLHHAAQEGTLVTVKKLIDIGFDINSLREDGRSILHHYAWENDAIAVKELVALGAKIDIQDNQHQSTPLGFAIFNNASKVINYLVDQSDNIIEVVACVRVDRARELLNEQPDRVYARTSLGYSLLHIIGFNLQGNADEEACEEMLDLLIKSGLDIYNLSDDGKTALEFARDNANQQMIEILSSHLD